jgi:hypothetical protein
MRKSLIMIFLFIILVNLSAFAIDSGVTEVGTDVKITYMRVGKYNEFTMQAPSLFRIGYFVDRDLAFEFRVANSIYASSWGNASATNFMMGISKHFENPKNPIIPYLEGVTVFNIVSGDESGTQVGIGGGIGIKGNRLPVNPRAEFLIIRHFESKQYTGATIFQINCGISFFIK